MSTPQTNLKMKTPLSVISIFFFIFILFEWRLELVESKFVNGFSEKRATMRKVVEGHVPGESYFVVMKETTDEVLERIKSTKFENRDARISTLIDGLKNLTSASQREVLPILERHRDDQVQGRNGSFSFSPLWIINEIILTNPSPRLIDELAGMDQVVGLNKEVIVRIPETDLVEQVARTKKEMTRAPSYEDEGLWGCRTIGAHDAHSNSTNGTGVIVAVVDTGSCDDHKEMCDNQTSKVIGGYNGMNGANPDHWGDDNGHGCHVCGTIVGTYCGVAPGAKVVAVKVLDYQGSGSTAGCVKGLQYCLDRKDIDVINMSWGSGTASADLTKCLSALGAAGIKMCAACGNVACSGPTSSTCMSPANDPNVMPIKAMEWTQSKGYQCASFSSCDGKIGYAAGVQILSAWHSGPTDYALLDGTSMACPHVAGACALYLSLYPNATPKESNDWLNQRTKPVDGKWGCLGGMLVSNYPFGPDCGGGKYYWFGNV